MRWHKCLLKTRRIAEMLKKVHLKRNFLVLLFFAVAAIIGISWRYSTLTQRMLPKKGNWTKEATEFWLNGYAPCRYYRFRSNEGASTSRDWIRSEIDSKSNPQMGMEFTSAKLSDAIKGRSPSITEKNLQKELAHWSVPQFGIEYAIEGNTPFFVIISSTINKKKTISHHFHCKIFDIAKSNSQIEIWDYRVFH